MKPETVLILVGSYLLVGMTVAAYTVALSSEGKAHFAGFSGTVNPVAGLLETVFVWPCALYVNLKG
jgi:hypothetical protein